ncbi:MAG: tripartite tricarboxylate transporter substrate-binding protein, partial [Alcaligenaceae bacterium]
MTDKAFVRRGQCLSLTLSVALACWLSGSPTARAQQSAVPHGMIVAQQSVAPKVVGSAQPSTLPKLIKFVVPFSPGGSNDVYARALAQKLAIKLSNMVVVENKPGAGGSIGSDLVARAEPDGSTLLLISTSFATNAAVRANLPFDPVTSFKPVALVAKGAMVLIVGNKT